MQLRDNRSKENIASKSNSGKDNNWLLFDKSFNLTWNGIPRIFTRVALAKELWYKSYVRSDGSPSRTYKIVSLDIEEDQQDTSLKVYTLTLLGLLISVGII